MQQDFSHWDVIVVDDEPDNIGVIEIVFNFHSVRFRAAESGQQCIDLLFERIPTLILADIQMPFMSGYELLKHIRAKPEWQPIPVIAITAHAMSGDHEQAIKAGLAKPIEAMRLMQQIQDILAQKKGNNESNA
jgi:CheY-like chemotaxis protein